MNLVGRKVSAPVLAKTLTVDLEKGKITAAAGFLKAVDFATPVEGTKSNTISFDYDQYGLSMNTDDDGNVTMVVIPEDGVNINIDTGYVGSGKFHGMAMAQAFKVPEGTKSFEAEIIEGPVSIDGIDNCYKLNIVKNSITELPQSPGHDEEVDEQADEAPKKTKEKAEA